MFLTYNRLRKKRLGPSTSKLKNTRLRNECFCIPFLLLLAESMTVVYMHFFSSSFFCWWPLMFYFHYQVSISVPSWEKVLFHTAVYLNMILIKAGLYFFSWAFGSIWWIIEFIGYFLALENNLVICLANKSKLLKGELLWTYCFWIAEVTLKQFLLLRRFYEMSYPARTNAWIL